MDTRACVYIEYGDKWNWKIGGYSFSRRKKKKMEEALAGLKLSVDAAAEVEFVPRARNDLSALDLRIVNMIVTVFTRGNFGNDVAVIASELDRDVVVENRGDVSGYCVYAYGQFRHLAICMATIRTMPEYATLSAWFEDCRGMPRLSIKDASTRAGIAAMVVDLNVEQMDVFVCVAGTVLYLMEFVEEYLQ